MSASRFTATAPAQFLVVEDLPAVRQMLQRMFENPAVAIAEAAGESEARKWLKKAKALDVALLDINLDQDGNGFEMAEVVSAQFPNAVIIAVSQRQRGGDKAEMRRRGAHGYITKTTLLEEDGRARLLALIAETNPDVAALYE